MPIATGLALGLGIAGAAGSLGGSAIAANAAGNASKTQASADVQAAQINAQSQKEALAFEQQQLAESQREYNQNQTNIQPWLTAGQNALPQLQAIAGQQQPNFVAPTQEEAANDPGFQFALAQGNKALQSSAAAKGGLLTTGTLKQLDQYSQGLAGQQYNNVYNRDLTTYNANQQNLTSNFNRLAGIAGVGQQASQQIAGLPNPYSGNQTPQTLVTGGQLQAGDVANAGAARASGYASTGNIWGSGINSAGQMPSNLYLLSQLAKSSGGSPYPYYGAPYAPGYNPNNP